MYYKLIRTYQNGKAVHGMLYRTSTRTGCVGRPAGGEKECLTAICPTIENLDCLIPALTYRVDVTLSPRFKRPLPILLQVPGRSGIRFHRGTRPEHSKGCILVSPADEHQLTIHWLAEKSSHDETRLEIVNLPR